VISGHAVHVFATYYDVFRFPQHNWFTADVRSITRVLYVVYGLLVDGAGRPPATVVNEARFRNREPYCARGKTLNGLPGGRAMRRGGFRDARKKIETHKILTDRRKLFVPVTRARPPAATAEISRRGKLFFTPTMCTYVRV